MNRLAKKCLVASVGTHSLLLLILIFGSAFFVSQDKTPSPPVLKAVPTRLIDNALAGGGGSPKVAPSDAQEKGAQVVPQPVQPQHMEKPQPKPVEPPPKVEVKPRVEPKRVEVPKPIAPPKVKPVKEHLKE